MASLYRYTVFGLKIQSEIELPELPNNDFENQDVSIMLGKNPENLPEITSKGILFQAKENDFLFKLDTIGSFRIREGNTIRIDPLQSATTEEIRLFLYGSAMGALLQQRDLLALHGSSIAFGNGAIIFCGNSGAGKSSLAAKLSKRGFKFIADDITVVNSINDKPLVMPGISHPKLWEDVMSYLGEDISKAPRVRPELKKFRYKPDHVQLDNPIALSAVVILSTKNTPGFTLNQIKGGEKFNMLKNNTFRYRFLEGLGKTGQHFSMITQLASNVPVYHLQRPTSPLQLDELGDYFMEKLPDIISDYSFHT